MSNKSRVLETNSNKITQKYKGEKHTGVDLVGNENGLDNIIAHSDGVVVFCQTGMTHNNQIGNNASYGNCIKIQHNNGYYTLYAHMAYVNVKLNQKVVKGQIVGRMGNTGNSSAAHLHFEVFNNATNRIDPEIYLNSDLPGNKTNKIETKKYTEGTYQVTAEPYLNVRSGAGTNFSIKKSYQLTPNARQQNANLGKPKIDGLAKGCICTVSSVRGIWGKCPSGWICLDFCKKI